MRDTLPALENRTHRNAASNPSKSPHILVVDDNREIRELLARYLQSQGLRVTTVPDGRAMRRRLEEGDVDLLVLDLMLPGEGGLTLCRQLRAQSELPIIMLTAMAEPADRITGLETGADDYLTKPFEARELLARIRTVLRRTGGSTREPLALERSAIVRFADWSLHTARRELVDGSGALEPLSSSEFALLMAFLRHPQQVLSRDQLLDLAKGPSVAIFDRTMDTQVMRLRRKIEANPKDPKLIKTVWGGGYMFTAAVTVE